MKYGIAASLVWFFCIFGFFIFEFQKVASSEKAEKPETGYKATLTLVITGKNGTVGLSLDTRFPFVPIGLAKIDTFLVVREVSWSIKENRFIIVLESIINKKVKVEYIRKNFLRQTGWKQLFQMKEE
jgi:hypothetical protein